MVKPSQEPIAALLINGSGANANCNGGIVAAKSSAIEGKIHIRPAKPEDGKQLRALIQELADHQDMPDGPRIGAEQIAEDFRNGAMHSMVAIGPKGEMAAYAVYYLQPSSSSRGQIMHLEDLYIRPQFRRRGLGIKLLRELAKIAHSQRLPCIEWCVLRTNYGALGFYDNLPGIEDLTDRKEANKSICWRWEKPQWAQVQRKAKPVKKIEVLLDEPGQISERKAQQLADQWNALIAGGEEAGQKPLNGRARKQLQSGQLGAIVVQRKEQNDEAVMNGRANKANIIQTKPSAIVGMAFFHRKGYSTWQGKFPELDNIYVAESSRHQGIGTAIMAELTKIAEKMGATKVQWTAPEPSKQKCQHVPFFESLNAANLTDIEEWLLYRWNYEKSGMHSATAAAGGNKENSNGNGAQRKDC